MDERVVAARDQPPQPTGDLAELFVDQDLLEKGPALTAELEREAAAVQVRRDRLRLHIAGDHWVDAAARRLEIHLQRLEDLADERTRTRLERQLVRAQREVHRGKDGARSGSARPDVAGHGTVP